MYLEHFQLTELPFRLSPDPAFLYLSKHHARAKAYMESTIWFTDGFVVITGEIGSGKTTLIETFLRELEKDVVVAQVAQTQVSPIEFLQAAANGDLIGEGFLPSTFNPTGRYLAAAPAITMTAGIITIVGAPEVRGCSVLVTPTLNNASGTIEWAHTNAASTLCRRAQTGVGS